MSDRLPFDPYRLDRRPEVYSPRDWRYNTRSPKVGRDIESLVFDISLECANEISECAQSNPLRIFHFNMMSDRDWNNPNFDRLVQFAADLIELRLAMGEIRRPDQDFRNNINKAVTLHCAKQAADFPELMDEIRRDRDSQLERLVTTNIGVFSSVVREIEDMQNMDSRDRRDYDDRGRGGDRGRYERDDRYSRGDRGGRYGGRYQEEHSRDSGGTGDSHRTSINDRQYPPVPGGERSSAMPRMSDHVPGRYSEEPSYSRDIPFPEAEAQADAFLGAEQPIPYLISNQGKSEMDMQRHAAIYDKATPQGVDLSKETNRIMTVAMGLKDPSVTTEQLKDAIVASDTVVVGRDLTDLVADIIDRSVREDLDAFPENEVGVRRIHHTPGVVANSTAGSRHLRDMQMGVAKMTSLSDLAALLNRSVKLIADNTSAEDACATDIRAAVDNIDSVIAREINMFCGSVLRISNGDTIKSFMQSYDQLIETVGNLVKSQKIQSSTYDSLLVFCSRLWTNIAANLRSDSDVPSEIESAVMDHPRMGVAYLPLSYLVTYIPFTIKELGYQVDPRGSAITMDDRTPFLAASLRVPADMQDQNPEHVIRVMVTRDRKIFRVYQFPNSDKVSVIVPIAS